MNLKIRKIGKIQLWGDFAWGDSAWGDFAAGRFCCGEILLRGDFAGEILPGEILPGEILLPYHIYIYIYRIGNMRNELTQDVSFPA